MKILTVLGARPQFIKVSVISDGKLTSAILGVVGRLGAVCTPYGIGDTAQQIVACLATGFDAS